MGEKCATHIYEATIMFFTSLKIKGYYETNWQPRVIPKSTKSQQYTLSQQNSIRFSTYFNQSWKNITQTLFTHSYVLASLPPLEERRASQKLCCNIIMSVCLTVYLHILYVLDILRTFSSYVELLCSNNLYMYLLDNGTVLWCIFSIFSWGKIYRVLLVQWTVLSLRQLPFAGQVVTSLFPSEDSVQCTTV